MSAFMGKPDTPKPESRKKRVYRVELDNENSLVASYPAIHANYMRSDDGLVSFWQDHATENDILEVAYPLHRIRSIVEEQP